jgi:glycosyltransferase involved in cell wall biosynthesis
MHWYTQVLAQKIDILIVPDSCMFIRRKYENSRLAMHTEEKVVIPKTPLFDDISIMKKCIKDDVCEDEELQMMSWGDRYIMHNHLLKKHSQIRNFLYKLFYKENSDSLELSEQVIKQWKAINKIEPSLFPPHDLARFQQYQIPKFNAGEKYIELISQLSYEKGIDYVFFVPWLGAGGADLVSVHYINAIYDFNKKSNVVVILTDKPKSDNILLKKIKGNVQIIKFYELCDNMDDCDAKVILARLMVQMRPKYLHVINSRICFEMLCDNAKAIKQYTKIFISFFCTEIDSDGRIVGYPYQYLPRLYDNVDMIYSDNMYYMNYLTDLYGLNNQKMIEHYQPFLGSMHKIKNQKVKKDKLNILWTSRIDRQKRPDILLKIINKTQKKCPEYHFHIYGYTLFQDDGYIEKFKECDNVTFHGKYNGKIQNSHAKYDVHLYTSEYDGIPSVLIESIASGIPVIAPNVGGIGELIVNQETGLLVSEFDSVDEYLKKLEYVNDDYDSIVQYAKNAQVLLSKRHSWNNFLVQLENTNYFTKR